jgi:uncharacterized protein (TIGR02118 family)
MIKVSILYPVTPEGRFDMDYYLKRHVPLALDRLGPAIKGFNVDVGASSPPWPTPTFLVMANYLCESRSEFEAAYLQHAQLLQEDVANYTDIEPIFQISDVVFSH